MTLEGIDAAERECKRFLRTVAELKQACEDDEYIRTYMSITGNRFTGAVRRASLDVTRALAAMRGRR